MTILKKMMAASVKGPALGGTDSNTLFLLQSNTTDNSTTFTDSSASNRTLTKSGNVHHDTAQKKFGTSSIKFDGTADYIEAPYSADFTWGTADFTLDFWFRFDANSTDVDSGQAWIVGIGSPAVTWARVVWGAFMSGTTRVAGVQFGANGGYGISGYASPTIASSTWYHYALVRYGTAMKVYIDGTAGVTLNGTWNNTNPNSIKLRVGEADDGYGDFNGHLDEVRVSNIARWTSDFDVPTDPYG